MSEDYQLTLNDYKQIIVRRWLYFAIPFLIISIISVSVAFLMPAVYKSSGKILVESQQIPKDLIRSTVTSYADERIQIIQQRVLTRENLARIINKFDLFPTEKQNLTITEQVNLIRERISVDQLKIGKNRKNTTTIAFELGYEDANPAMALAVTNELITSFLEENVKTRTKRASETTEFLTEEAAKLKQNLEDIEEQLALFKQDNSHALPEHLDLHLKMLERTEASIKEIKREIKTAREERRFLDIELSAAKQVINVSNRNEGAITPVQELEELKVKYSDLISKYTNAHPDVKTILNKIAVLEKEISSMPAASINAKIANEQGIDVARVHARIDSVEETIRSLNEQLNEQVSERKRLEAIIVETPQVQRALVSLNRDYENTLKKYKEIQAKEMEAKLSESLEEGKKAERFTLIEPPIKPRKPIKPDRRKIIFFGIVLSAGLAGGLVMLLEIMDKRVRGVNALTALLKHRPLVLIPFITTERDLLRRKRRLRWLMLFGVLFAVSALLVIHFFYMPLELLMIKIMVKLG